MAGVEVDRDAAAGILGRAAVTALQGHEVDTAAVLTGGEGMELYFVTSIAGLRATERIYDRASSAFAKVSATAREWDEMLAGIDRLRLSGQAVGAMGWRLARHSDPPGRDAVEAAFAALPKLRTIASTTRTAEHIDLRRRSARVDTRERTARTCEVVRAGMVDRIGGGDAFAAGVLHALRSSGTIDDAARHGLALAALNHLLSGDASLFRQVDLDAYLAGCPDVRQ